MGPFNPRQTFINQGSQLKSEDEQKEDTTDRLFRQGQRGREKHLVLSESYTYRTIPKGPNTNYLV